ncbi:MAG: hypothetical protein Q27BPR15_07940 [Rhodobacter sp. CACIA14H1]|nr:MAG: hypothetical protein Q27BPR15_07940 [Rhodobacter sp. CACIA14H1]
MCGEYDALCVRKVADEPGWCVRTDEDDVRPVLIEVSQHSLCKCELVDAISKTTAPACALGVDELKTWVGNRRLFVLLDQKKGSGIECFDERIEHGRVGDDGDAGVVSPKAPMFERATCVAGSRHISDTQWCVRGQTETLADQPWSVVGNYHTRGDMLRRRQHQTSSLCSGRQ